MYYGRTQQALQEMRFVLAEPGLVGRVGIVYFS